MFLNDIKQFKLITIIFLIILILLNIHIYESEKLVQNLEQKFEREELKLQVLVHDNFKKIIIFKDLLYKKTYHMVKETLFDTFYNYSKDNVISNQMIEYKNNFINMDLTIKSNLSASSYDKLLINTPLYGYGWIFEQAEKKYEINGIFLLALTGQEQGYGSAETSCKPKYNLTSWGAFDGEEYKAVTFDSYWDCIDTTAKSLKNDYLNEKGKYYKGKSLYGVNQNYASDKKWSNLIAQIMDEKISELPQNK